MLRRTTFYLNSNRRLFCTSEKAPDFIHTLLSIFNYAFFFVNVDAKQFAEFGHLLTSVFFTNLADQTTYFYVFNQQLRNLRACERRMLGEFRQ